MARKKSSCKLVCSFDNDHREPAAQLYRSFFEGPAQLHLSRSGCVGRPVWLLPECAKKPQRMNDDAFLAMSKNEPPQATSGVSSARSRKSSPSRSHSIPEANSSRR